MNKRWTIPVALTLLAIGAMFVAACGGDDDGTGGATATATTSVGSDSTATDEAGNPTDAPAGATTGAAGTQPAIGGIQTSDTCELLTESELEDALGEPMQDPVALDVFDASIPGGGIASVGGCGFTSESFASSISLTYWNAPGLDQQVHGMIQLACGSGQESISGLGDQACWYDDQHAQIQLAKGGVFIDIFATMSGDASDVLLTLAEAAVSKL